MDNSSFMHGLQIIPTILLNGLPIKTIPTILLNGRLIEKIPMIFLNGYPIELGCGRLSPGLVVDATNGLVEPSGKAEYFSYTSDYCTPTVRSR